MNWIAPLRARLSSLLVLAGCATPQRVPELVMPLPPPVAVSENVWGQVDSEICAEAQAAIGPAGNFAQSQMAHWRQLVTQRTEADFIPWFSSYWTQQWVTAKVAWYNLSAGEHDDPPVDRLAAYLQEQYHERVLGPVAREIDPATRRQSTKLTFNASAARGRFPALIRLRARVRRRSRMLGDCVARPALRLQSFMRPVERRAYAALLGNSAMVGGSPGRAVETRISPVARNVSEKYWTAAQRRAVAASTLSAGPREP